ncbi:hypothetical protein DSM19430T_06800 [Desulfovibrio psychrotolerans]|uniref:histidine kinase n=1 Tax=Desulfovibrio psychrotolerans TaxID=415242 RepID=A0A7J0BQK1_9BACT|nr:hypothetical protein DSM19430T_06800 [Desulfovibrio psychrotolerans]
MYAVFGVLWIRFSVLFLASFIDDPGVMMRVQTYKGWFFIVVTAMLLFVLVRRNLSAQRAFEQSLRVSRMQLQGLFQVADTVAFLLSRRLGGKIVIEEASPGAVRLFGLDAGAVAAGGLEAVGLPAGLFTPTVSVAGSMGGVSEMVHTAPDGTVRHLLVSVVMFASAEDDAAALAAAEQDGIAAETEPEAGREGTMFLTVALDVSERRRAEQALLQATGFIRNITDTMPSVLIGVDAALRVTHWNAAARMETGIAEADALGEPVAEVFPLLQGHSAEIAESLLERRTITLTMRHATPGAREAAGKGGGATYVVRCHEVQVFPLGGVAAGAREEGERGAVIRVDDVSERTRMQELLVQTEKMMSVGGLAAGMAHEINNPLGGVLQGVQNIRRRLSADLPVNQEVAEETGCDLVATGRYLEKRGVWHMLDGVFESGKRAAEIVSSMLEFSRTSDLSHSGVDLHLLLDKALDLAGKDYDLERRYDFRNIRIVREYDPDMPPVLCSRIGIEQVLLNLLRNAAQAMGGYDGGPDWKPCITLRTYMKSGYAYIEVQDNGPGMNEDQRRRAFEPFFTTKPVGEGTGLGLSVSYYIITSSHSGQFELRTEPDKGALFRIKLPVL